MNYIYKIYLNEDVYVGSTNDYNRRMMEHKRKYNNPNSKQYNSNIYQFIRENGGWDNFNKKIIFETDKTGKELLELERYYIETLKSNLNSEIPTRNKKEWYENNKEKLNEKSKKYREKNKEKIKERKKEWYENNKDRLSEKIKCEICNSIVIRKQLLRHQRTKKCLSCKK
jgi:hypothetical protein